MTPNEAVVQIWTEFLHCGELDNDLEQEAVEIIKAAIATATAELRGEILTLRENLEALRSKSISQQAKLAAAEKLVAKWLAEADNAGDTDDEANYAIAQRDCAAELQRALKGA